MVAILVILVCIPILWAWLAGHWFGQVLAFLMFAAGGFVASAFLIWASDGQSQDGSDAGLHWLAFLSVIPLAAVLASLPKRIRDERVRAMIAPVTVVPRRPQSILRGHWFP